MTAVAFPVPGTVADPAGILVGRVTTRKGARLHLALNGLASCGAGSGRITGQVQPLTVELAARLCRRCAHLVRRLVAERVAVEDRRRDRGAPARLAAAQDLDDALRPAAEVAAQVAVLAELRARMAVFLADPQPEPLTWEQQQAHRAWLLAA